MLLLLFTIMYIAIPTITADTTPPLIHNITFCVIWDMVSSLKAVSIVDSSIIIETHAAAKETIFAAE